MHEDRAGWTVVEEAVRGALPDPLVFLIETPEHATDYYRRQALRVVAALRSMEAMGYVSVSGDGMLRDDDPPKSSDSGPLPSDTFEATNGEQ